MIIATLAAVSLPVQFSYKVPSPKKRVVSIQTHGAVKTAYTSGNVIVPADSVISWVC